jgi:pyridoxal phosphate enzyme (YggS family)
MNPEEITERVRGIMDGLPEGVVLVGAVKTRTPQEVAAAMAGGLTHLGHNYVQEAERMKELLPGEAVWHLIGHLQRNKAKKAVELFDLVETLDSVRLAEELDRRSASAGRVLPVLIEVNSGREPNKTGVLPEGVDNLAEIISRLEHLRLEGLMTMGPDQGDPELARPYFRTTREIFDRLGGRDLPGTAMKWLSMGMSNSYRVALEEGANILRLGTILFGHRTQPD